MRDRHELLAPEIPARRRLVRQGHRKRPSSTGPSHISAGSDIRSPELGSLHISPLPGDEFMQLRWRKRIPAMPKRNGKRRRGGAVPARRRKGSLTKPSPAPFRLVGVCGKSAATSGRNILIQ